MTSETDLGVPLKIGAYKVLARLGRGGMGEVYRGFDERLRRPVALKNVLTEDVQASHALERLRREARAIAQLNHPAIVQIYDWIEDDDGCWYVMELVEGRTLKAEIGKRALPVARVVALGCAIADALAASHQAGIVHRDLKADNVMIADSGRVKLLDFGLAKQLRQEAEVEDVSLTDAGKIIGSVSAMSPEQAAGEPIDERSDLFSLGILLYYAATGKSPFKRQTAMQTLTSICTVRQEPPAKLNSDVPPALSSLIDHLLEKEPARRPQRAEEVLARLRALAVELGVSEVDVDPTSSVASFERSAPTTPSASEATTAPREPAEMLSEPTAITEASTPAQQAGSWTDSFGQRTSERRQITVLSAGVETQSDPPLDPETLYELLPALDNLCREIAARWQCHLEEVRGHRLVLCFGYPLSHENETRRAVLAALDLTERVRQLGEELNRPLEARIGLETGLAVVAVQVGEERLLLGHILDLAHGLRDAAPPGSVLLGERTYGLVDRYFDCQEERAIELAGGAAKTSAHRVIEPLGESTAEHDLEFVARREELDLLLGRCRLARSGEGQVVLLSGSAGIGKSRLVRELESQLLSTGVKIWKLQGSPFTRSSAFSPVLDCLRRAFDLDITGVVEADDLTRLERFVTQVDLPRDEVVPYLATLLAVPLQDRYRPPDLGPRHLQARIQEVILSLWLASAQDRLLVLLVEDLQWIDPSTLDLLGMLIENASQTPVAAVLTCRTEWTSPWQQSTHLTRISLERLEDTDIEKLLINVAQCRQVSPEVCSVIGERTDGVPLYVEELTKALLEAGDLLIREDRLELAGPADHLTLPPTLRDSLASRLDRVGPARQLAQIAAVLGREFSYAQLAAVAEVPEKDLDSGLADLARSELVLRKGFGSRQRYFFKHALIQEAAYESLLAGERKQLHRRIADALEKLPEVSERQPERLARHLTEAGLSERAAGWWLKAAEQAISRSAHQQGIAQLETARELVEDLPPGPSRAALELSLATKLGAAAGVLKGYSAPEVREYWSRASELCSSMDDSPELFWVIWGLWSFHLVRAKLDAALELGRRLLRIAEAADDDGLRLVALGAVGQAHYFRGELVPAGKYLDLASKLDDSERRTSVASATGQDVGVVALAARALVLWHLGEDGKAVESSEAAIGLAERIDHSYSLAFARVFAARLHQSRRDLRATEDHARAVISLSQEKGYFWLTQGTFFLGCQAAAEADAGSEPATTARGQVLSGLEGYRMAGARLSLTYMLAQVAGMHLAFGEIDEAQECLDEAFAAMEKNRERFWEAELLRLRGQLLIAQERADQAGEPLRRAFDLAAERGDRAFELRAALSLGQWLVERGETLKARRLVGDAVGSRTADGAGIELEVAEAFLKSLNGA